MNGILPDQMSPSGMGIAFDRLWLVAGGNPRMVSAPLKSITKEATGWPAPVKPVKTKAPKVKEKK